MRNHVRRYSWYFSRGNPFSAIQSPRTHQRLIKLLAKQHDRKSQIAAQTDTATAVNAEVGPPTPEMNA